MTAKAGPKPGSTTSDVMARDPAQRTRSMRPTPDLDQ
jgi:hypothetical protein